MSDVDLSHVVFWKHSPQNDCILVISPFYFFKKKQCFRHRNFLSLTPLIFKVDRKALRIDILVDLVRLVPLPGFYFILGDPLVSFDQYKILNSQSGVNTYLVNHFNYFQVDIALYLVRLDVYLNRIVTDFEGRSLDTDRNFGPYGHFCGTIIDVRTNRNHIKGVCSTISDKDAVMWICII